MKRTTSLKRKTPLRKMSKARAPEYRRYLKLRAEALKDAVCEWPATTCTNPAVDIHHESGRYGVWLNDKQGWWKLCRHHHRACHDHPADARKLGLLKP